MVFHYASEIFEGLKAYRLHGGGGALFRPEANAARFYNSAVRMAMAPLPEALFVDSVRSLARADRDWMPSNEGGAALSAPVHDRLGYRARREALQRASFIV